ARQFGVALLAADMRGRIAQAELGIELSVWMLVHQVLGHDIRGGKELSLDRKEGRRSGRVIVKAHDVGVRRLRGEFEILRSATRDGDDFRAEIFRARYRNAVRPEDADRKSGIGRGESDLLSAFRGRPHGRDYQVEPVRREVGYAVGPGNLLQFDLDAERFANQVGNVDVEPDRLVVGIDETERRNVDRHADSQLAGCNDLLKI